MTSSTPEKENDSNATRQNAQAAPRGSAGQSNPSQQGANGGASHRTNVIGINCLTYAGHFSPSLGRFVYHPPSYGGLMLSANHCEVGKARTPALPSEFKAGEIIGWRCWRQRPATYTLANGQKTQLKRSMHMSTAWYDDSMTGDTNFADQGAYAWKTRAQAEKYASDFLSMCRHSYPYDTAPETESIVIGSVYLWGQVIEHEEGYRGEYAKVKDIVQVIHYRDFLSPHLATASASMQQSKTIIDHYNRLALISWSPPSPEPSASIGEKIVMLILMSGLSIAITGVIALLFGY